MKKTKNSGGNGILILGGLGLAAVAGFAFMRSSGGGLNIPNFMPTPEPTGTGSSAGEWTYTPTPFTVGNRYTPNIPQSLIPAGWPYNTGGLTVTAGGATLTPTLGSDYSPTSTATTDQPVKFGVSYR